MNVLSPKVRLKIRPLSQTMQALKLKGDAKKNDTTLLEINIAAFNGYVNFID